MDFSYLDFWYFEYEVVSVATEPFSAGETYMIWSIVGVVCGIAGLAMAFTKE